MTTPGTTDDFADAPCGAAPVACPLKAVTFVLTHASDDAPVTGGYVLERPDGALEPGELVDGVVHRDDALPGQYKVHLPHVSAAAWSVESVALPEDGGSAAVALTFEHRAIASGTATISIFVEGSDQAPIHRLTVPIAADQGRLLEKIAARVSWDLEGLPPLRPGDGCGLGFEVEIGSLIARTTTPLLVGRAPKPSATDDEDG